MRRAQAEMVGLVFIVIVLVVGVVLYLRFAALGAPTAPTGEFQGATSFLVSLKETTVPACRASFERVAIACLRGEVFCDSRLPCFEAEQAMRDIAAVTLDRQGLRYNLSVEGVASVSSDCDSGDPSVNLVAAPQSPLLFGGARSSLILALC